MFTSFKSKLLTLIVGILLTASVAFMIMTSRAVERETLKAAEKTTQDELNLVMLAIANEYQSLSYHREYALSRYKEQVKNLVAVVMYRLEARRELALRGLITEKEAKQTALDSLKPIRYGHNDYFFAVDYQTLRSISHPDPAIMGTDMTNFQDIKGKYVVREQQRVVREHGEGYVSHWHIRLGEAQPREKLTYVRLFKPWGWIVGTGIYIDDIESETQRKLQHILEQLRQDFARITIGESGYLFLFDGSGRLLIHPSVAAGYATRSSEPVTGSGQLQAMMNAAKTPDVPYRYTWNHPRDPHNYRYAKQAYVRYFQPLDWYVGASVYLDELRAPARAIVKQQAFLTTIVFLLALALSWLLVSRMAKPLNRLAAYTQQLAERDFSNSEAVASALDLLAASCRDEVGRLARIFASMIRALQDYIGKLTETTAARERIESELRVAHDIQMGMLPKVLAERPEFDIYATVQPAREVGGDFYDFFFVDENHICLAVGDVSGKGVPASLFMAVSKTLVRLTTTLIRAFTAEGTPPDEVLRRVNAELVRENDQCMFVTIFLSILQLDTGEAQYANAGHNPPFLMSTDGTVRALDELRAPPVGVKANASYGKRVLRLLPGDMLFLYTDGITEAENSAGMFFSEDRLRQCLASDDRRSSRLCAQRVLDEVATFRDRCPQNDDMTLLVFQYRRNASRRPEPRTGETVA